MRSRPSTQAQAACRNENGPEDGFVLIAVLFLVALIVIGLAVAAPQIAKSIQRDKELELVHRGEQYKRAIKLYYRKFGAYPNTVDQLINTNQIRFLRKRYTDPMTGKDDWKLVYFGQAHVQPMGLFGQTLTAGGAAGLAGATSVAGAAAASAGAPGGAFGSSSGSTGGSSFGSSSGSSFGSSSGSSFGSSSGSSFGSSSGNSFGNSTGSGTGSTDGSNGGSSFGSNSGSPGFGASGSTANGTGTNSANGAAFGSSGSSGSTLGGGGPIVGVVIPDSHTSMREYKKQKHYNEWEFVYNPIEEQMQGGGLAGGGQQNLNGTGTSGNGFSSGSPTPGFGSSGLGGSQMNSGQSTGSGSTTPQPQQ